MTRFTLIRHGETEWNRLGKLQGRTDIPLNATGEEQAHQAGRLLSGSSYSAILSSPLMRAMRTAEIIASYDSHTTIAPLDGVQERNYGQAEGLTDAEYRATYGSRAVTAPGAETPDEVRKRVFSTLDALMDTASDDDSLLIATHGGVISRVLKALVDTGTSTHIAPIGNCSVHVFEHRAGRYQIIDSPALVSDGSLAD